MSGDALGIAPTLESEREERKETWQESGLEALAAFANTRGGTLWIGVKDNGVPVEPGGWPDAGVAGKMEAISNKIVSKLGLHPASMTIERVNGKPVLAIRIDAAPAPVSLDGHYWRRVGNTSRRIPAEELQRFLLERTAAAWDAQPCAFGIDALDAGTFEDFKTLASHRLPAVRPSDNAETILNNLQLRDDAGRILRAAVLLFGRDREAQRLSPTAFVQVGRFKGDGTTIVDDRQITGNLFVQLNGVEAALRDHLQVRYEFPAGEGKREGTAALQRVEVWEYPFAALREAVANALLHRDYSDTGRVMIRIYDDRILISSPGLLPEGVALADLTRDPHRSKLRNPLLAQAFFFAEIVERWGTGTTRMARLCAERGLPAPEFAEVSGEMWVTFRKDPYTDERLRKMDLSSHEIQAVYFVRQHGEITNADFRNLAGVSDRTAARVLESLFRAGIFERRHSGPRTAYVMKGLLPANPATIPPPPRQDEADPATDGGA